MPRPSFVVVIVEDERQKMLVYRYLRKNGLSPRQIRPVTSPSGQGSAEQWVRSTYSDEVKAHRIRCAGATAALIVMIDADAHSVQERLTQLDQALQENGVQRIRSAEQIVRLVPKRNVETWILCLTEQTVGEVTDYKGGRDNRNELIPGASETLFQWTRTNAVLPVHCIDSLRRGVSELNRLTF
jgi:hypothetical protein